MNIRAAEIAMLLTILLIGTATTAPASAADEIRGGKWQFTTEMQMPASGPRRAQQG